jgi:urocanate hydratase
VIRAPRGREISCKGWHQEAALRMLMNNLDPEVAENPAELIVYGGTGRAARDWECFHAIVRALRVAGKRRNAAGAIRQAGGRLPHHSRSPARADRQLQPGGPLVQLGRVQPPGTLGLTMYGQMTAGSWIYIGSQGIVQGTYETFAARRANISADRSRASWSSPAAWAAWAARSRWPPP